MRYMLLVVVSLQCQRDVQVPSSIWKLSLQQSFQQRDAIQSLITNDSFHHKKSLLQCPEITALLLQDALLSQ